MAGIANLLFPLLGSPDPSRQLAAMLSGQQPQGAPPQGAAPPAGPPSCRRGRCRRSNADPRASATARDPRRSAAARLAAAAHALQSSPDMQASYQQLANPPNLMSLYMQMQQRDQAMQGFNSGLALIAANHSPPSHAQRHHAER